MPPGCRLPVGKVVFLAQSRRPGETRPVNGALIPIRSEWRINALKHVLFATGRPIYSGDVVAQQPSRWPKTLRLRYLGTHLKPAILKTEQALSLQARRCVHPGRGLLCLDMKIAVCANEGAGIRCAARGGGRTPGTVGLQFVVSKAAVAGVIGPELWIGLRRGAGGVSELVAPDHCPRRDVGRKALAGDSAVCLARVGRNRLEGEVRCHQKGRLVLLRRCAGCATVDSVVDGCARRR